jgi:hypothetical protein
VTVEALRSLVGGDHAEASWSGSGLPRSRGITSRSGAPGNSGSSLPLKPRREGHAEHGPLALGCLLIAFFHATRARDFGGGAPTSAKSARGRRRRPQRAGSWRGEGCCNAC